MLTELDIELDADEVSVLVSVVENVVFSQSKTRFLLLWSLIISFQISAVS